MSVFKKLSCKGIIFFLSFFSLIIGWEIFSDSHGKTLAQIRGEDSQEFFNQGSQQMDQEIQNLENQQPPEIKQQQQQEQSLEQNLNVDEKNIPSPTVQEVPSPPLGNGDNVPTPPPDGEVQININ